MLKLAKLKALQEKDNDVNRYRLSENRQKRR